jgi:hypothetical protein
LNRSQASTTERLQRSKADSHANRPCCTTIHHSSFFIFQLCDSLGTAQTTALGGDPTTVFAGKFHCLELALADMGNGHVTVAAIGTRNCLDGGVTKMTGIVGHGTAIFTRMSHNQSPLNG